MSSKVPRDVSGQRLLRAFERMGFQNVHTTGSHHYLRHHQTGRATVISVHGGKRPIPIGTLRAILRQAGISAEDLAQHL